MGPWVHEYRPNPVQSSTHCAQLQGKPAAATVIFNWYSQGNTGFNGVCPHTSSFHKCQMKFCLGHYVLLKALLLYSRQWEIMMDPAGVFLDLMVPV